MTHCQIILSFCEAVLGAVMMDAFYVVFDREHKRVGFAVNSCPNTVAKRGLHPKITGPHLRGMRHGKL